MDEIKVNDGMMETVQMATDMAEMKRTDPERYDDLWEIAEHEITNMVKENCTEDDPMMAMLKESVIRTMLATIKKNPSIMLNLEQFIQEVEES